MKGQKKLGTPTTPNEKNDTQTVYGDVPSRGHSSANKENFCADRKRLNRKRQQRVGDMQYEKKRKLNDAQSINGYLRMDKQRFFLIKTDDVKAF